MEYNTQRKRQKINEDNIKSLRINNIMVHNQVSSENKFKDYFLNIEGKTSKKN